MAFCFEDNGLKHDLSSELAAINANTNDISLLKINVQELQTNIPNTYSTKTDLSNLANRVTTAESSLSSINSRLSKMYKSVKFDGEFKPANNKWGSVNGVSVQLESGLYIISAGTTWYGVTGSANTSGYRNICLSTDYISPDGPDVQPTVLDTNGYAMSQMLSFDSYNEKLFHKFVYPCAFTKSTTVYLTVRSRVADGDIDAAHNSYLHVIKLG